MDALLFRSHVANDNHVQEAIRLFNNATMDAARSGINQHMNLSPEMANEIKVRPERGGSFQLLPALSGCSFYPFLKSHFWCYHEQQAETQIKRRMGIGSHISERRLIDELARMGMNESIVSACYHSIVGDKRVLPLLLLEAGGIYYNCCC